MSEVIPNTGGIPDDGSPEGHVEKMAGLSTPKDSDQQAQPEVRQRPETVPEKFWDAEKGEVNVEALLKAQQDAEKALRGGTTDETDETSEPKAEASESAQANVVESASNEWAEKGELSEDTFKSLESVGISREMVTAYIDGQQAVVGQLQQAAYTPFNGQEGYDAAADWAAANLSDTEIKALDVQLTSTNPEIVAEGAKALLNRYQAEADIEPGTIRGNANDTTSGGYYKSSREMMLDMGSTKYRTDSSFRQEVMEKMRRSQQAGINLFV